MTNDDLVVLALAQKYAREHGGSGANIWSGTMEEYEEQKDTIPVGSMILITDDGTDLEIAEDLDEINGEEI